MTHFRGRPPIAASKDEKAATTATVVAHFYRSCDFKQTVPQHARTEVTFFERDFCTLSQERPSARHNK